MTHPARACIVGAYEHPPRLAPDKSVAQLHAECAAGALQDAGLSLADVDGFFCAGDAPGAAPLYLADYPLGHLIALQIEEQIDKATSSNKTTLGAEIERMCVVGAVPPDAWMQNASGEPVSAGPLLRATERALSTTKAPAPKK